MKSLTQISAPSQDIIGLAEAKAQLKVDFSEDDELIELLVASVNQYFDGAAGVLGRALVTQTWEVRLEDFWSRGNRIYLPLPPLRSVTSVKYLDDTNTEQTLSTSRYVVGGVFDSSDSPSSPLSSVHRGFIELADGATWPSVYDHPEAVRIRYVAGYGARSAVPGPIKQAARVLLTHWYDNKAAGEEPMAVGALLAPYREHRF